MTRVPTVVTRLYSAALYLYPAPFRREFADEMRRDFDEASREAWLAGRRRGLLVFWARVSADLAATIVLQWARTPLPVIALLSPVPALLAAAAAARLRPRARASLPLPPGDADILALLVLSAAVILLIAGVITLTLWFARPLFFRPVTYRPRS